MNTTNLIWITPDAEKFIAEIARVSNPANQKNPKYDGLIKYLIKNNHWSPFEMAAACFEINTSRRIAPQILRHRSFTFQEFCITGDSLITTVLPSSGLPSYIPIESLYKKQNWKNYKNIKLRVYDNDKLEFTTANFNEIVFNGNKKVFRVTLSDGKTIKCTEKHKFLTPDNEYVPLDELVGMEVTKNNIVTMKYKKFIAVNGEPSYRNFDWLSKQRNENPILSVQTIADRANCSYHTIRKWLKIHKLNFSPLEISKISPVWNKGKFGYSTSLVVTEKHKEAIRKARSKEKSNWWKGGVERSERQKIADWTQKIRKQKLLDFNFTCNNCKIRGGKLELDHVKAVYSNPELAYEYDNIQVLCKSCHDLKHHLNGDTKKWRTISKGNTLTTKWCSIDKISYIGVEPTYDIYVDHPSHNYVANKIVVHNSTRYAAVEGFVEVNPRSQDLKNRQSSHDDLDEETKKYFQNAKNDVENMALRYYNQALEKGIAKESAAFLLPMSANTKLYMQGTIRSWIHYCNLRTHEGTQLEHRNIALEIKNQLSELLPNVAKALGWIDES